MALNFIPFQFPGLDRVRVVFQILDGDAASPADHNISLDADPANLTALANRRSLLADLALAGIAENRQVHGSRTVFEPRAQDMLKAPQVEADGLATSQSGLGLLIKTADCQPLLLADKAGRHIAALHVGWRGNRLGCPRLAAREFCARYGLRPEELMAVRGPSLGPAASEFVNFAAEWGDDFRPWFDCASRTVALWRLTDAQLLEAGLRAENIFHVDLCTFSLSGFFYSYRRDRGNRRQASLIWLA